MELDELSRYWAERLFEIRPLAEEVTSRDGEVYTLGLYGQGDELVCVGNHPIELENFRAHGGIAPQYTENFGACLDVIKYLQKRGAWVKIVSPFIPNDEQRPVNPSYWAIWEETRDHWWVSVDFQGTTDTNPPWQAGGENPAQAICDAGRQWLDYLENYNEEEE